MPKFKQTLSGNLRYKIEPEFMLSRYEINKLHSMPFESLLEIDASKQGELNYSIMNFKTLGQELSAGIEEERLADIVHQTLQLAGQLKHIGLSIQRTMFSPSMIFVDSRGGQLKFVYLPVNGELMGYDEILFIKDIILQAKLSAKARIRWDQWVERLVRSDNYDAVLRTIPQNDSSTQKKNIVVDDEAETALGDGQVISDFDDSWNTSSMVGTNDDDDEAPTGLDGQNTFLGDWGHSTQSDDWDDEAPTGMDEFQKIDVMDKSDGTFFESLSESASSMTTAKLVALATNETIFVNGNSFKLGRSQQRADYCISNNSVSNVHATIIRKGNKFYIKDNHSTNSTYLDGVKVNPDGDPVELKNGSIIRLWTLEYRFVLM